MAARLVWTRSAVADLEQAADYIQRDSAYYAAAFVRRVRSAARLLSSFPQTGSVVPEFNDSTIRERFVHSYRLIFQTQSDTVFVLGLIHGSRDLVNAWNPDERRP